MGAYYNKFPFVVVPQDHGDCIVYTAYRYHKTREEQIGEEDFGVVEPILYLRTKIIGGQPYGQMGRERACEVRRRNKYYKKFDLDTVHLMKLEDAYKIITELVPKAEAGERHEGQIIVYKDKK